MVSGVNEQVLEENLRLVDLWEVDLRDFQQLTPHTIEGYLGDGRRAAEIFASANTSFTGLNKLVLRTYFTTIQQQTERPEGLSHARMKSIFTALNSLMEYLVYDELATVNPVPAFRKRSSRRTRRMRPSPPHVRCRPTRTFERSSSPSSTRCRRPSTLCSPRRASGGGNCAPSTSTALTLWKDDLPCRPSESGAGG